MLNLLLGPKRNALHRTDATSGGWTSSRATTRAAVVVDEEIALTYSAVWSATRLLSETSASLPLILYRRGENDDRDRATDLDLYDILKTTPNPFMGSMSFREGRTQHQINWGNGFAEIERERLANLDSPVVALWPIHPGRVRAPRAGERDDRGQLVPDNAYVVRNDSRTETILYAEEMLHVPGVLSDDGIWGKGVIQYARENIGAALGTERHGATFFGGGAQPKGIVKLPGLRDPEARKNFRKEWKELHGSPDAGEIAIIPTEGDYKPVSLSNQDSQFLETRAFSVQDVARWYRVPPHMLSVMDAGTMASIEQMGIEFIAYSLMPWLKRWEEQINLKLLTRTERKTLYVEHLVDGLLRGDYATRMNGHRVAITTGIKGLNQVMKEENLNNIGPDGDKRYLPSNLTTIDKIGEAPPSPFGGALGSDQSGAPDDEGGDPTKKDPTADPTNQDNPSADARVMVPYEEVRIHRESVRSVLVDALRRMLTKEGNAAKKESRNREFPDWLAKWHETHQLTLASALRPSALILGDNLPELVAKVLDFSKTRMMAAYNSETLAAFDRTLKAWPALAEQLADELMGKEHGD